MNEQPRKSYSFQFDDAFGFFFFFTFYIKDFEFAIRKNPAEDSGGVFETCIFWNLCLTIKEIVLFSKLLYYLQYNQQ